MEKGTYSYWIRTSLGLENIVLEELREKTEVKKYEIKQRSLFVQITDSIGDKQQFFKNIRTADDIYEFVGVFNGIDNTKPSVDRFIEYFKKNILPTLKRYKDSKYFRVTVSFVGERNFNRFFVENEINNIVKSQTHFKVLSSENDDPRQAGEFRLRCHIEEKYALLGIAIFDTPLHRRDWRVDNYDAQLSPPVAAAMVRLARSFKPSKIIDPFCGSGTIIIESALVIPNFTHTGFDINVSAIDLAKNRAKLAGVNVSFENKNAFEESIVYDNSIIISNPPWGGKHALDSDKLFVSKLCSIISKSNGAVIIAPEEMILELKQAGLKTKEIAKTRVRGKLAVITRFSKQ